MEAFEDWYPRVHPRVVGAVFAACGDVDVAMEATDESVARALPRWKEVSGMAFPEAWVCRVAINVMRRRLRRRSMEARLLDRRRRSAVPEAPASEAYPEVWVRDLPERQRLAVVLRYVGDLPEAGIATALGVTRGSVSASLATARARLKAVLNHLDDVNDLEAPHA
ncbi:MAG: RNA polymerase sigma factor [Acidimicrobiales bacterium]